MKTLHKTVLRPLLLLPVIALLAGCFGVPTKQLEGYKKNFATVKLTATDLYLQTDIYADDLANNPRNPDPVATRLQKLDSRKKDKDARLHALNIIDNYNEVLSALATGTDPSAVAGNIESISTNLKAFKIDELASVLVDITPYTAVISQAIGLIDDAIKAKEFKQAVYAAEQPIIAILKILKQDADTIHADIVTPRLLEDWSRKHVSPISAMRHEFHAVAKAHNDAKPASLSGQVAIKNVAQLYDAMNNERTSLVAWPNTLNLKPIKRGALGASTPSEATLIALDGLVRSTHDHVVAANKIRTQLDDHANYIKTYKDAIDAVSMSFSEMKAAIESERLANIVNFSSKVLELRKAYLKIRKDTAS